MYEREREREKECREVDRVENARVVAAGERVKTSWTRKGEGLTMERKR